MKTRARRWAPVIIASLAVGALVAALQWSAWTLRGVADAKPPDPVVTYNGWVYHCHAIPPGLDANTEQMLIFACAFRPTP